MKKIYSIFSLIILTVFLPAMAISDSITEITAFDSNRQETTELAYVDNNETSLYSGTLLGVFSGNDSNQLEALSSWLTTYKGYSAGFMLTEAAKTDYSDDSDDSESKYGTWSAGSDPVSLYAVKAGNAFALYALDSAQSDISWNTYELWIRNYNGNGGDGGIDISHISGYNSVPIPEPATMALIGIGLLGIAGVSRRKIV